MADYSDQEEIEKLKNWWNEYGNALVVGVVIGAALVAGNKYWSHYKEQRLQEASTLYEQLLLTAQVKSPDVDTVRSVVADLTDNYSATPYAGMAALNMAKVSFESGDLDDARTHLEWVEKNASDSSTRHTARLRLARIVAEQDGADAALAMLDVGDKTGFESEYLELKGDLMLKKDNSIEARNAYRKALEHMAPGSAYVWVLKMKLDDLGEDGT